MLPCVAKFYLHRRSVSTLLDVVGLGVYWERPRILFGRVVSAASVALVGEYHMEPMCAHQTPQCQSALAATVDQSCVRLIPDLKKQFGCMCWLWLQIQSINLDVSDIQQGRAIHERCVH
jgi:hypothetical protein